MLDDEKIIFMTKYIVGFKNGRTRTKYRIYYGD